MGSYQLQEVKTLDGLILDTTLYNIEFTQKDLVTKTYEKNVKITNKTTIVEFSKQDISGNSELIGAKLSVIDENGGIIDTWLSTEQPHKIEGLISGKKYILREEQAPDGYMIAEQIEFTVDSKQEAQVVVMKDKPILQEIPVIQTGNPINNILLISSTIVSTLGITIGTIILKRKF